MFKPDKAPKSPSLLAMPDAPASPIAEAVTAAKAHAADLKVQAQKAGEAALQQEMEKFGLRELDAAAQARITYLASREPEVSAVDAETTTAPADRAILLQHRPGLQPWLDAVEAKRDRLQDITVRQQARLVRARADFAALTAEDLMPREGTQEAWHHYARWGKVAPRIFAVYAAFGNNLTRVGDIDERVRLLKAAHAELLEHLAGPVDLHPRPAPVLAVSPRSEDQGPLPSITEFDPFDHSNR